MKDVNPEIRLQGIGVSPGVGHARVHIIRDEDDEIVRHRIDASQIGGEITRFENALIQTRVQILEMQQRIAEAIGTLDAGIFDAHLLVVEDRTLIDEVLRKLEADKCNVEAVFRDVAARYAHTLSQIDDPYLRERAVDIEDVMRRVIRNLQGKAPAAMPLPGEPYILVAHNLAPSDTATLDAKQVLGIATDLGSRTSHTAIMARSLGIPAVVGLHDVTDKVKTDQMVLLHGSGGLVIVDPTSETLAGYQKIRARRQKVEEQLSTLRETRSATSDGRHIVLSANIELPQDVDAAAASGAEGIGLYRTEFLYLNRDTLPDEEEQFTTYLSVAQQVAPHPLIIRTFDLGGDKVAGGVDLGEEMNPFLGWRAIRFCLEHPDIFKTQLRAMLRASVVGNVKVMFPMISGLEELRAALALFEQSKGELKSAGLAFDDRLQVGAMIEVPSAALCSDTLAREVDFFSIGTNDLIQYTIAVDRVNERVAHLHDPTHPAVLHLLKQVAESAHKNNIWVGVCGEMAADIALVPLLVGLGMDELSVGTFVLPRVKLAVQRVSTAECQKLVEDVMQSSTSAEIRARCEALARERFPDLLADGAN